MANVVAVELKVVVELVVIVSCELLLVVTVIVSVPEELVLELMNELERVDVAVVWPLAVVVNVEVPDR